MTSRKQLSVAIIFWEVLESLFQLTFPTNSLFSFWPLSIIYFFEINFRAIINELFYMLFTIQTRGVLDTLSQLTLPTHSLFSFWHLSIIYFFEINFRAIINELFLHVIYNSNHHIFPNCPFSLHLIVIVLFLNINIIIILYLFFIL